MELAMQIIALIIGLFGVIEAAIATVDAIKQRVAKAKEKTKQENWETIKKVADAAMQETEHSEIKGPEAKLDNALEHVKNGCKAIDVDVTPFLEKLKAYINDTINFINVFNKKGK